MFLSTDNQYVYNGFLKEFGQNKLVHIEGFFDHIDFIDNLKIGNGCISAEKAVLDIHLLAKCDAIVISRSQFGRMAVWLRDEPLKELYVYNSTTDGIDNYTSLAQFHLY